MRSFVLKIIFLFFLLALFPSTVFASEEFKVDVNVEYLIGKNSVTTVTHKISLENLNPEYYARSYSLSLQNIDPNEIKANESGRPLAINTQKEGNVTIIKVEFSDALLGKGKKREFSISFDEKNFVNKTGEVWEVSIPRLSDANSFSSYNATLIVPDTLGRESYLSPEPESREKAKSSTKYFFSKETIANVGISAAFGEFQVFSFTLKYHLENPLEKSVYVDIAMPPDTAFQKMYYTSIGPKPTNVYKDMDGNWLARFDLGSREKKDIQVQGSVQIFSSPKIDFPKPSSETLSANLKPAKYWDSSDPKIIALAAKLKTPEAIYNYVATTLSYDYTRVRANVERLGSLTVLENPKSAICMEFTDLFVALSRAAGIPAREVNGYAYTENPAIEPLSLVADVLHAWPEYWDSTRSVWIPVDPTWGNTTNGVDFFHQLDLRHFTFVIHGVDSEKPYPAGSYKLGTNPQKDIFVNFGQLPMDRSSKVQINTQVKNRIPLIPPKVTIDVSNTSFAAAYNQKLSIYFDNKLKKQQNLSEILPYGNYHETVEIPYSLLFLNMPEKIRVIVGESQSIVPTGKITFVIYNLTVCLLIIIAIVLVAAIRAKRLKLPYVFGFGKNSSKTRVD